MHRACAQRNVRAPRICGSVQKVCVHGGAEVCTKSACMGILGCDVCGGACVHALWEDDLWRQQGHCWKEPAPKGCPRASTPGMSLDGAAKT